MDDEPRYTLSELEAHTGLSRRRIRHYIQEGLVEGSSARGPGSTYSGGTLRRLELITQLKARPVSPLDRPLATGEIRALLADRGEAGLHWLAEGGSLLAMSGLESSASSFDSPGRELRDFLNCLVAEMHTMLKRDEATDPGWERWLRLRRPDLEIHLRAPANSSELRRLRRLASEIDSLLGRRDSAP